MALSQEFSFIQELIWSPPYRNPFPKCSDKVIWGLKAGSGGAEDQRQWVESSAVMLIDLRRTLCNLLAALRASGCEEVRLLKLENDLDDTFVQHMAAVWKDETQLEPLDQAHLMARINACMEPFTPATTVEPALSSVSLVEDTRPASSSLKSELNTPPSNQTLSSSTGNPSSDNKNPPEVSPGLQPEKKPVGDALDVEMTMKARVFPEQNSWRVIFGLINHGCFKIDVDSLSFWPQGKNSEITTVKWPRGEVTLNEKLSFICYSASLPFSTGPLDSPRLSFTWSYRKSSKLGKRARAETGELCYCPLNTRRQKTTSDEDDGWCLLKRIKNVFSWRGSQVSGEKQQKSGVSSELHTGSLELEEV